jgi:hypothetical protein
MAPLYDVLSLSNSKFGDVLYRIYPTELELKDTTNTARSASYLDIHLENDIQVQFRIKPHYKIDDVISRIVNSPDNPETLATLDTKDTKRRQTR